MLQNYLFEEFEVSNLNHLYLIKNGTTIKNKNVSIRFPVFLKIEGIETINGDLNIFEGNLESLGDLKELKGELNARHTYLSDLGNLEHIESSANLTNTLIKTTSKLKYVGGDLNLRDSSITELENLKFVGGNLFLPIHLKNKVDISKIQIKGKIRYWMPPLIDELIQSTYKNSQTKEYIFKLKSNYYKSGIDIPTFLTRDYIDSVDYLYRNGNNKQIRFYEKFREYFYSFKFIDLKGNDAYAQILMYELFSKSNHNIKEEHLKHLLNLFEFYPRTSTRVFYNLLQICYDKKLYDIAHKIYNHPLRGSEMNISLVYLFSKKLNRNLVTIDHYLNNLEVSFLSNLGRENVLKIIPYMKDEIKNYNEKIKDELLFYLFNGYDIENLEEINSPFYKQYFENQRLYEKALEETNEQLKFARESYFDWRSGIDLQIVTNALRNELKYIVRISENKYRAEVGLPKIGEGWISETELYYKIKNAFPTLTVIHHGRPMWIGRQHLDIYIPYFNIAIEYQGKQHYEPVEFFGGEETLTDTIKRDELKRKKCLKNNCRLIEVKEGYVFEDVLRQLKTIIENKNDNNIKT